MKNDQLFSCFTQTKQLVYPMIEQYLQCQPPAYREIICEYPRRQGKYLRPSLVLLSTALHGGNPQAALKIAVAIQLSEEWLLIHDDVEDHAKERRSTKDEYRPSLNQIIGDELAINAGDTLQTIMWQVVADAIRELPDGWSVFDKINDIILKTTEGQYLELDWIRHCQIDLSEADYFHMVDKKTCNYTITGPLQLGALITGRSPDELADIEKFSKPLGRAFQVKDDLINLTIDHTISGKEQYDDLQEGKRTLILLDLLSHCSPIEKEYITTLYSTPYRHKNLQEISYLVKLLQKYDTINRISQIAVELSDKAQVEFDHYCQSHAPVEPKSQELLRSLIGFIAHREH